MCDSMEPELMYGEAIQAGVFWSRMTEGASWIGPGLSKSGLMEGEKKKKWLDSLMVVWLLPAPAVSGNRSRVHPPNGPNPNLRTSLLPATSSFKFPRRLSTTNSGLRYHDCRLRLSRCMVSTCAGFHGADHGG